MEHEQARNAIERATNRIRAILAEELGESDSRFLAPHVLGDLLLDQSYQNFDISNNYLNWGIDSYVMSKLEGLGEKLLKLHSFLVRTGAKPKTPYDFGYADCYGVAFADETTFKTMAFENQNVTYMVLLCRKKVYDMSGSSVSWQYRWEPHLRMCTKRWNSRDFGQAKFSTLAWLKNPVEVGEDPTTRPEIEYFKYRDARDRGYLCSVDQASELGARSRCVDTLQNLPFLQYVLKDLTSHLSVLND